MLSFFVAVVDVAVVSTVIVDVEGGGGEEGAEVPPVPVGGQLGRTPILLVSQGDISSVF